MMAQDNSKPDEELKLISTEKSISSGEQISQEKQEVNDQSNPATPAAQQTTANNQGDLVEAISLTNDEFEAALTSDSKLTSNNSENNLDLDNDDDDIDGDPIPSGTGQVSKDCSASELVGWSEVLPKWHSKLSQRPKGLSNLVRQGIPEPLRGEIWQLLSNAQESSQLMSQYPILLVKSAPTEQTILRDVHRTYPAHENFRNDSPVSLIDSLFKVCKAYAVYDEEVGYCQGLSFLAASLLLHMPEEQAFCVFVRIMQDYGLRNLFKNNFEELYLKFYQLDHLLQDQMPDLHSHFANLGIEPFMYASQWFLTVFTAKFPLNAVFYILDIFLLDGMNTIFQVALALLSLSKAELLQLNFEGVLKYFRVQLPKRYRNQENVQKLMTALSEISLKRLKKHAKSYEAEKLKEKLNENPVSRLQKENTKLTENNLRLEQENDDLARELVSSKIQLRSQMDQLEDKNDSLNRSFLSVKKDCATYLTTISDIEDEKARLEVEVNQLKEVCRRELQRTETEISRNKIIIKDYKKISRQLSERQDAMLEKIEQYGKKVEELESDLSNLCLENNNKEPESRMLKVDSTAAKVEDVNTKRESLEQSTDSESSTVSKSINKRIGAYLYSSESMDLTQEDKIRQLTSHVDELEVELARTKLALVEAECKCQKLTHDLNVGTSTKSTPLVSSAKGKLDSVRAAATRRMMSMVNVDILS